MSYEENIIQAINYIESNLNENLSLEVVASQAYYSSFHFHRLFSSLTRETPGSYLRKRRLSQAAVEMLQTDKRLLDIALDYQFQSQESFTRAFKKFFGVTPGQYRRNGGRAERDLFPRLTLDNLHYRYRGDVFMEPEFKKMAAMNLVGLVCSVEGDTEKLPQLWHKFLEQRDVISGTKEDCNSYGVCFHIEESVSSKSFMYMACVETKNLEDIPTSMVGKTIPEAEYAIFTHKGPIDKISNTYEYIYGPWLSKSEYAPADFYDFELYNDDFSLDKPEESKVYICVPVIKKAH